MRQSSLTVVFVAGLLATVISSAHAASTPALGGPGGGPGQYLCNDNERLVGIGARYGSWLDWVGPICAPVNGESGWANMPRGNIWVPEEQESVFESIGSTWASFFPWNLPGTIKGLVGPKVVVGTREPGMGGEGGSWITFAVCPENFFVYGFDTTVVGGNKNFVARLSLRCRNLQTNDESWVGLPASTAGGLPYYNLTGGDCPEGEVANGIHGRSGIFVDAFGLTCRPTASRVFCNAYASQAVAQVQQAQQRGCGFGGPRWTPNHSDHYGWCMALGGDQSAPKSESAGRTHELSQCKDQSVAVLKNSTGAVQALVQGQGAGAGQIKALGKKLTLVTGDVDVYDIPDGVGQVIGMLRQGDKVRLVQCRADLWCQIRGSGPGGMAWVWGEFLAR